MINNILNETIVSSDVLEILKLMDESSLEKLYERIKIEKPTILSQDILKEYLVFDVSKKNGTGTLTINKFVEMLNARYNLFQKILVRKVGFEKLISINKCSSGQATIIGIVDTKEIKNDKITLRLEDPTGSIEVIALKNLGERINLDDVIAVSGNIQNKILSVDEIIFPF